MGIEKPAMSVCTLRAVAGSEEKVPTAGRHHALALRVWEVLLLGVLPAAVLLYVLIAGKDFGFDLRQFWQGGRDVVDGVSPYPSRALLDTASASLDPRGIQHVFRFPYPAGSAVALAPLALLPFHAAAVLLCVVSTAAVAVSLWLLNVRDWRCYGATFGSIAVITAIRLGTMTPVLLLAAALAWRYRDRRWAVGAAVAAAVVLKVFLWPLIVWLAATRRFAAAGIAAASAILFTLVAWSAIGFAGLHDYPRLVRRLTDVVADRGFSLAALASDLGAGRNASYALVWIVGGLVLLAAVGVARGADGDRRAFALAITASILLTPIVWLHYFALLVAPIAIWRRSFSVAWLLPLLLWLSPAQETSGDAWRVALGLALAAATLAASVRRARFDTLSGV
jgi:hypothetical protein